MGNEKMKQANDSLITSAIKAINNNMEGLSIRDKKAEFKRLESTQKTITDECLKEPDPEPLPEHLSEFNQKLKKVIDYGAKK